MKQLEYFGTNLTSYGHFYWDLEGNYMDRSKRRYDTLPFDAEYLPGQGSRDNAQFGDIYFGHHGDFTVFSIYGSCTDHRRGTQSVFFIEQILDIDEMIEKILSNKLASQILRQMPFEIKILTEKLATL